MPTKKQGNSNTLLHQARNNKKDEFYTQLCDIENELCHYKDFFKDKVVLCNCDDPYESNFFKYFAMHFNGLGLKKLIATCYDGSPIQGEQLELAFANESNEENNRKPYKIVITEVKDENGDGRVDLSDVEYLIKNKKNVLTLLEGNGDFRSRECIELLKEADVVVTNPPFSLFREYVAQLVEYDKKFLIIGNQNSACCKDIFSLIIEGKLWLGYGFKGGATHFRSCYEDTATAGDHKEGMIRVSGVHWFTNIEHKKLHTPIPLYKRYTPEEYPKYDNYDAIEVSETKLIPEDYDGVMGVPVTFLDKYCPEQFEILGCTQRGCHDQVPDTCKYDSFVEKKPDGTKTGSTGGKTNENGNLVQNDGKHNYFENVDGKIIQSTYSRIFIKQRRQAK